MYKIAYYLGNRTLLNNGRTSCQWARQHGVISNLHLAKKVKLYSYNIQGRASFSRKTEISLVAHGW